MSVPTPQHPSPGPSRAGALAAVAAAVLLLAGASLLLQRSDATTTASTANRGNDVGVATATLTNGTGSALLDLDDMAPGDEVVRCVEVTYEGDLQDPSPVRVHLRGPVGSGLARHLTTTLHQGAPGGSCGPEPGGPRVARGSLAELAAAHRDHGTGAGEWSPQATEETVPWWVVVELDRSTPSRLMGQRVDGLVLVWELTA